MRRSFGGVDAGGLALCLQFEESTRVVRRRDIGEWRERGVPIFEEGARPRTAGEQVMALEQDAQPRSVEAQRVAHVVVMNARRALPRPVVRVGIIVGLGRGDWLVCDLALIAEARAVA